MVAAASCLVSIRNCWACEGSAPSNAFRLETYIQDADRGGDQELAEVVRRAQNESRKGGRTRQAAAGLTDSAQHLTGLKRRSPSDGIPGGIVGPGGGVGRVDGLGLRRARWRRKT